MIRPSSLALLRLALANGVACLRRLDGALASHRVIEGGTFDVPSLQSSNRADPGLKPSLQRPTRPGSSVAPGRSPARSEAGGFIGHAGLASPEVCFPSALTGRTARARGSRPRTIPLRRWPEPHTHSPAARVALAVFSGWRSPARCEPRAIAACLRVIRRTLSLTPVFRARTRRTGAPWPGELAIRPAALLGLFPSQGCSVPRVKPLWRASRPRAVAPPTLPRALNCVFKSRRPSCSHCASRGAGFWGLAP